MNELKTDAAEAALQEHLKLTGGRQEWATHYHQTITGLRRELMSSSVMFDKMGEPHNERVHEWFEARRIDPELPRLPQAVYDAGNAAMMAAAYAYTLAAVLAVAERDLDAKDARHLALWADEILTNGDFDCLNVDVQPEGTAPPPSTQGLELILPSQPKAGGDGA